MSTATATTTTATTTTAAAIFQHQLFGVGGFFFGEKYKKNCEFWSKIPIKISTATTAKQQQQQLS